jgi:plastocyanin
MVGRWPVGDPGEVPAPRGTPSCHPDLHWSNLTWDTEELTADAGTVTVLLTCEEAVNHNVVIAETDEVVAECAPGETVEGTVELEAGEHTYVCTVPGHSGTMRGTLTIS